MAAAHDSLVSTHISNNEVDDHVWFLEYEKAVLCGDWVEEHFWYRVLSCKMWCALHMSVEDHCEQGERNDVETKKYHCTVMVHKTIGFYLELGGTLKSWDTCESEPC
jgi:hypothetical protein